MSSFLYFVEGSTKNAADVIAEHRLEYADIQQPVISPITLGATPSGNPGFLLQDAKRSVADPTYRKAIQKWQKYKTYWVGMWSNEDKPRPETLERNPVIPGYELELGDGNKWRVPLARQSMQDGTAGSQLPHQLKIDDDGNWIVGDVTTRYRDVWDIAGDFFDRWHLALSAALEGEKDSFVFDYDSPQSSAIKILQANYVISDAEASLLGLLLSNDTAGQIMRAACDCDVAMMWILEARNEDAKKNEAVDDGLSIAAGVEDCTQDTHQLSPI